MPILHMQTEAVRSTGQQINQTSESLRQQAQQLHGRTQQLANEWQGPSASMFEQEMQTLLQRALQSAEIGGVLNQKVQKEVNEWERVAAQLGGGAVSNGEQSGNSVGTTESQQERLSSLEEEYYRRYNEMVAKRDELNKLRDELKEQEEKLIKNGFEKAFDIVKNMIKLGQMPTPWKLAQIVGSTSIKSVIYAKEAIEYALKDIKYTDMVNEFNKNQGSSYKELSEISKEIQQIDPNWQPPNIHKSSN